MKMNESHYLNHFFEYLNRKEIRYCVMNNYINYPDVIESDVDIAIDFKTFASLDELMSEYSRENLLPIIQKIWHGNFKCAYIFSPIETTEWFRLQLDFFADFTAKGYYRLIPSEIMIENSRGYKNFFVPLPKIESVFLMMRRIIKDDISPQKHLEIQNIASNDSDHYEKVSEIFGSEISELLRRYVNATNLSEIKDGNKSDKKKLRKYASKRSSLLYKIKYEVNNIRRLSSRVRNPVGLSICVLGVDGSGKSTLIEEMPNVVGGAFHGYVKKYWSPSFFPAMGALKFWNPPEPMKTNPDPHGRPKIGKLRSIFKLTYYFFDFLLGYYLLVKPLVMKKNLVVFDRYFYDVWIDPTRHRLSTPSWLHKTLCHLIPAPDIILVLDVDPEVAISRKTEISFIELERQSKLLRSLGKLKSGVQIVNANQDKAEVLASSVKVILGHCAYKLEKATR